MNWIKNSPRKIKWHLLFRYLILNIGITIILVFVLDILITFSYFDRAASIYKKDQTYCKVALTGYDSCKSIIRLNWMDKRDRVLPVINYMDEERHSTYRSIDSKPPITKMEKIYILGDSFVQAAGLFMEERIEHFIRVDGYDVKAFGYSSWNTWQFEKIAKTLDVGPGDKVFIFSMTNDYTPNYGASTIKTLDKYLDIQDDPIPEKLQRTFTEDYLRQSFFVNRIYPIFFDKTSSKINLTTFSAENATSFYHGDSLSCDYVKKSRNYFIKTPEMYDFYMLSMSSDCWDIDIKSSVKLNIDMLLSIKKNLEKKGATVNILLVPAGWAFKNENTIGRVASGFPVNLEVSNVTLINFIRSQGLEVDNLEIPIMKNKNGENDMYYPVDGHWNSNAHKTIYKYIKAKFFS